MANFVSFRAPLKWHRHRRSRSPSALPHLSSLFDLFTFWSHCRRSQSNLAIRKLPTIAGRTIRAPGHTVVLKIKRFDYLFARRQFCEAKKKSQEKSKRKAIRMNSLPASLAREIIITE